MSSQNNINFFSQDKFKLALSNVPTLKESTKDLQFLYENYLKSVAIPEYSLETIQSMYKGNVINHPISKKNDGLSDLTLEFKLDENFRNYFNLFEYMQEVRYGDPNIPAASQVRNSKDKSKYLLREYDVDSISILLLDNERITRKILRFDACMITSLGTIALQYGVSEEISFTVGIKYREVFLVDP